MLGLLIIFKLNCNRLQLQLILSVKFKLSTALLDLFNLSLIKTELISIMQYQENLNLLSIFR